MIHIAYGTQAELIKLMPVLAELRRRGTEHRVIDTGQHAGQTRKLRGQFGMPSPDAILDAGEGIYGFGKAGAWSARILANALFARHELRTRVFAPGPGVCVIHGDTFTTLP